MPKHYEKNGLPQRLYQTLCRLTGEAAPHLVVAVSGGKDSMALLYALSEEARQKGCILRAIHIDHGLRKQSRYEAMLVEKACRAWKIPLIVERLQVNANRAIPGAGKAERAGGMDYNRPSPERCGRDSADARNTGDRPAWAARHPSKKWAYCSPDAGG